MAPGLRARNRKIGKYYSVTLGLCGITLRVIPRGTRVCTLKNEKLEGYHMVHNPEVMTVTSKLCHITPGLRVLDEYPKIIFICVPLQFLFIIPLIIIATIYTMMMTDVHPIHNSSNTFISNCWWYCWWF